MTIRYNKHKTGKNPSQTEGKSRRDERTDEFKSFHWKLNHWKDNKKLQQTNKQTNIYM